MSLRRKNNREIKKSYYFFIKEKCVQVNKSQKETLDTESHDWMIFPFAFRNLFTNSIYIYRDKQTKGERDMKRKIISAKKEWKNYSKRRRK